MLSMSTEENCEPVRSLKQIKVDNWGTFFLQRLLQLYFNEELLDLDIKFHTSDNILKVHRLVVAACTDYFLQLEREQNGNLSTNDKVIFMPRDMPYESVKSVISFIYTGQLEYWTSERNTLYNTAKKMNISVLTKLIDAQTTPDISQKFTKTEINKNAPCIPLDILNSNKRLPISKRKFNVVSTITSPLNSLESKDYYIRRQNSVETSEGPSRFDLPEVEELTLGVFSSFDDITYNTQPIVQAPEKNANDKRANEEVCNEDIPNEFLSHSNVINFSRTRNKKEDALDDDWIGSDENSKYENNRLSPQKKFRFDFDQESRIKNLFNNQNDFTNSPPTVSFDNHAKIIREVLKKYPHLVQHNKNIRLKIMQRESRNTDSCTGKTKISYVELKSDFLMLNTSDEIGSNSIISSHLENNDIGPWKCLKCSLNEEYRDYYMFRRHMQDVHGERFDPRICEHCGYKATKRNILMYHMYTKHNVPPPKNMSFPKCHICPYIALSESLLIRHQVNHKHQLKSSFDPNTPSTPQTTDCEESISDYTQLVYKKTRENPGSKMEQQFFHCFNCDQQFSKIDNFKLHLNSHHKNLKDTVHSSTASTQITSSENDNDTSSVNELFEKNEFDASYKKELVELQQHDISDFVDADPENEVFMLIENAEDNRQSYDDDFAENNKILVQNDNANTIVYIRKLQNDNIEENSSLNTSSNNYIYNLGNAEVVEEVVEELETLEDEQLTKKFSEVKRENNIHEGIHSSNKKVVLSEVDNLIQYVEEETEILEYETHTEI